MRILKQKSVYFSLMFLLTNVSFAQKIKPLEVKQVMKKVSNWQIDNFYEPVGRKKVAHPLDWVNGAFYVGLVKWANMADDKEYYYSWMKSLGEEFDWKLYKRKFHADDHTVGQLYIDLYKKYQNKKMITPIIEQFDDIIDNRPTTPLTRKPKHNRRWNWCDALFMSPPVWAKLYKVTGDKKYLNFMISEYKATTDFLYDKKEDLYYRDERFITKRDKEGKVFWSRGNGWVFAGLVNIMNELDSSSEEYEYFLGIYKKMANKLVKIQTKKGHWAMSLLAAKSYPTPETSGSCFYIYGLSWGINKGILTKKKYKKSVYKGWNAMISYVNKDGMLGYVQPIGAAPGNAWRDQTEVYGVGAFLCAGSEVYKMIMDTKNK